MRRRKSDYGYIKVSYRNYRERVRRKRRIIAAVSAAALLIIVLLGLGLGRALYPGREEAWKAEPESAPVSSADGEQSGESRMQDADGGQSGESRMQDADGTAEQDAAQDIPSPLPEHEKRKETLKVKGIYVTGRMAGSEAFQDLLELVDETELNTMVIDVKDDEGRITYETELETARGIEAQTRYISDMEGLMRTLKEHHVYTIARIVCFKDPLLAEKRPELALKGPDGTPVTDSNGLAWVNPYRREVWEYLTEVAGEAAAMGFDEIQFDYVRFPIGADADAADYGVNMLEYTRQQAITDFLTFASEELGAEGVPVTADVFGTIIGSDTDKERTGQDYAALAGVIDVLCPMVYPSHYSNHVFGLDVPDAHPYETVYAALTDSGEELSGLPPEKCAAVRPWLQAFTATWVQGHISYGGEQIRQQIQAVYDAGYDEWILWNATNRYSAEGLLEEPVENSAPDQTADT